MLPALIGLAAAAAGTPGPNNVMLASSGATFGLRRTLPHVMGVALGFPVMIFLVGLGLGEVFQASALLREGLRWGGAALMLWVAWNIARAGRSGEGPRARRPFTFAQAAGFQWINPKGWAMAIAITAQFLDAEAPFVGAVVIAGVFVLVGMGSASAWAMFGTALQRWLAGPGRLEWFNRAMGALLAGFVALLLATG